jgi:hypothetical protein
MIRSFRKHHPVQVSSPGKSKKEETIHTVALISVLLIVALLLRLPGYDGRPFWIDELWRIHLVLNTNIMKEYWPTPNVFAALTSPLYLLLNRAIAFIAGIAPETLRISSLISGLLCVPMAFFILRKTGAGFLLACAGALFFALNADFIQYSNEFKPYMFETLVHLCCFYVWLNIIVRDKTTRSDWLSFFGIVALALFCTPNIIFLLPAFGLSLLSYAWKKERAMLWGICAGFMSIAVLTGCLYMFLWSYGSDKGLMNYWSDSFYQQSSGSYFVFAKDRLFGLWRGAFTQVRNPDRFTALLLGIYFLALAYGAIKTKLMFNGVARYLIIFYTTLVFVLLGLNYAGFWPLGQIRPNQFVYGHIIIMFILVLQWNLPRQAKTILACSIIAVMLHNTWRTEAKSLVDRGPPIEENNKVWAAFLPSGEIGKAVATPCGKIKVKIFTNPGMSSAASYFLKYDAQERSQQPTLNIRCTELIATPDAYSNAAALEKFIAKHAVPHEISWFAYSHLNNTEANILKTVAAKFGKVSIDTRFKEAGYFMLTMD